jgi:uncharacterized protein (TIGR03067 family)
MKTSTRILLALLAVAGLTAFAPAPFPRPKRDRGSGDEISLQTVQGTWRVVSMQRTSRDGKHMPHKWAITHIRIRDDKWTFMEANNVENTSYRLKVDGTKQPGLLDYYSWMDNNANVKQSVMVGAIRRKGNMVEILYLPGNHQKPTTFDPPPEGWWLLVLQKER